MKSHKHLVFTILLFCFYQISGQNTSKYDSLWHDLRSVTLERNEAMLRVIGAFCYFEHKSELAPIAYKLGRTIENYTDFLKLNPQYSDSAFKTNQFFYDSTRPNGSIIEKIIADRYNWEQKTLVYQSILSNNEYRIKFLLPCFIKPNYPINSIDYKNVINLLWSNKEKSFFKETREGTYKGICYGELHLRKNDDWSDIGFNKNYTDLKIQKDIHETYDKSTKTYEVKLKDKKIELKYEIYGLANILTLKINNEEYSIGIIEGACDTPIKGLFFDYLSTDNNIECLYLQAYLPLELSNLNYLMKQRGMGRENAMKLERKITIGPRSEIYMSLRNTKF